MAEGDSKKKRSTAGEESQAVTTDNGVMVDPATGEILDDGGTFDVFDESYDEDYQGGGGYGDMQESYDDSYQDSFFEVSQVKLGRGKD